MTTTAQKQMWTGKSRKTYEYTVYGLTTESWNDVPGNYIFAKKLTGGWNAVYIGETESFKDRIPNHEKWECAKRNGATHIHAHNNNNETARTAEETDLRHAFNPPCNLQ